MSKYITHKDIRLAARLMRITQSDRFAEMLRRVIYTKLPISTYVIIIFSKNRLPNPIYSWIPNTQLRSVYLNEYIKGAYQFDPFYEYIKADFSNGLYHLKDIAPDRYFFTEYYQSYYKKVELKDEIGFLVSLSDGSVGHLSFSRSLRDQKFSRREIAGLKEFAPVVTEMLRQFCEARVQLSGSETQLENQISLKKSIYDYSKNALKKSLTKREAEITALVLQGHSSASISQLLQISLGTVKVHRKNIYRKLEISTQAELFFILRAAFQAN